MTIRQENIIVSEVLRSKSEIPDDEPKKKSREDWRKAKELEEARKVDIQHCHLLGFFFLIHLSVVRFLFQAGTAPAAVDEEGKDINPHIRPTLKHQRIQDNDIPKYAGLNDWSKRGVNEV